MAENTPTLEITRRHRITDQDLEQAFQTCDDTFWQKAVELFPEVTSGDTDPLATGIYTDTVKAFMKHWLRLNADISIGDRLTEADAATLLEQELENHQATIETDGHHKIPTGNPERRITLKVVRLTYRGQDHGHAVQVTDPITNDQTFTFTPEDLSDTVDEQLRRAAQTK